MVVCDHKGGAIQSVVIRTNSRAPVGTVVREETFAILTLVSLVGLDL